MQSKQPSFLKIFACVALSGIVLATPIVAINGLMQSSAKSSESQVLNLNPNTDQTIFTTAGGLEIKSHKVAGGDEPVIQYFTLGAYEGTPINWLIIGASPSISDGSGVGNLINGEGDKQKFSFPTMTALGANQLLVISANGLKQATLSITPKGSVTGSLPGNSYSASGWAYDDDAGYENAQHYASLLVDQATDYYTSYTPVDVVAETDALLTNNSLGLADYLGTGIVNNATFTSSTYAVSFTKAQFETYLTANSLPATNLAGQKCSYWCSDAGGSVTKSVGSTKLSYNSTTNRYAGTGSGSFYIKSYIDTTGTALDMVINGSIGYTGDYSRCDGVAGYYTVNVHYPTCSYQLVNGSTTNAFYIRPAMVVDFSKF